MENTENYYLISQLALMTGLTDRTLRNYMNTGILKGEKINGVWHFTPGQIQQFIAHPTVRPSILAKYNALIYDFLSADRKTENEVCIILDVPSADKAALGQYFCREISNGNYTNIRFAYDGHAKTPRVIITGKTREVLALVEHCPHY